MRASTAAEGAMRKLLPQRVDGWSQYSLKPSGREIDAELSYGSRVLGSGWLLGANPFTRPQPGQVAGAETDYDDAVRFTLGI